MPAPPILDRSKPPAPEAVRPFHLPKIKQSTLENGLEILVAEDSSVPIATATLLVRNGSASDPKGKAGVASLVSLLLTEGTKTYSSTELAKKIDFLGASLGAGSSHDATYVRLGVLSRYLPQGLELLFDTARNPIFPEKEVDRVRGMRLDSLKQIRNVPGAVAADRFNALLYEGTPYAEPASGTEASVRTIVRDDLVQFHRTNFVPNNSVLVVTGDVEGNSLIAFLEARLADWKKGEASPAPKIEPKPAEKLRVFLVDRPGSVQSVIRIGNASTPRNNPDFFPQQVMNGILGGKFTSRVNLNLREKHGYTYGAHTGFEFRRDGGPFCATADVQNPVTGKAVRELLFELNRIRDEDVTDQELSDSVSYLQGVFPYMLETADDLGSRLVDMKLHSLPADTLVTYRERIGEVTKAEVRRVAKKYLDPGSFSIVVVGKASEIAASLREIAPVAILDVDGNKQTE